MKKLINEININSLQEAEEILKSAGTEDLFEKAKHNVGDMHPNGKWIWTQLPSGKFDWRVKKNNSSKDNSGNVGSSPNNSKKRPIGVGTNGPEKKNKKNIPSGKKVSFDDDIVEVYDDKGRKVYSGLLDDCPYKYENYKWNESDKNYDLPKGYKMVGK